MAEALRGGEGSHAHRQGMLRNLANSNPRAKALYGKLRYEVTKGTLRSWWHAGTAGHVLRKAAIRRFLAGDGPRYLQVGGGYHVKRGDGWLNADIIAGDIYLNAIGRIPLPDASIDLVFTEQFIEHLPQEGGLVFLREALRVLKPGGVLRQSTPDLNRLISVYLDQASGVSRQTVVDRHINVHRPNDAQIMPNGCQYINDQMRMWAHQFIYDEETMQAALESVGFTAVKFCSFGESSHPAMQNLERHADSDWMKTEISMFCEAERPR
jgi:predicted SAM-dependent methyltransferase